MVLFYGLLISIFLDYVRPGQYFSIIYSLKLHSVVPISVLIGVILSNKYINNSNVIKHTNSKLLAFFGFLLILSIFTADVTLYSYNVFIGVLGYFFWYFIICKLTIDLSRLRNLLFVLGFSHVIVLIINPGIILNPSIRQYLGGNPFLGDGNDFALSVCIVLPFFLYLYDSSKNKFYKLIYIVSALILILGVVGTQSRGGTLSLVAISFYILWTTRHKIFGVLCLALITILIINFAPSEYFDRLRGIQNYETDGSAQGRITAWKSSIQMVIKHPFTGVGSGHFPVKLGTDFRPESWGTRNLPWQTAHSVYFLILGELGLPGIIFLISLLWYNYRNNIRLRKDSINTPNLNKLNYSTLFNSLNCSLIGFSVGGAFLSVAYYPHIFVLTGIMTASSIIYHDDKNTMRDGTKN